VNASEDHYNKFLAGGYMPLCIERLGYRVHGLPVYSMTHYGEQNGDLMRDPDITFTVDQKNGLIDPLSYQNDYAGTFHEVYDTNENGEEVYRPRWRKDIDDFLKIWTTNIYDQGFTPDACEEPFTEQQFTIFGALQQ